MKTGANGPWYITYRAAEQYRIIRGWPDTDDARDRADYELIELASKVAGKAPTKRTHQGHLVFRGPRPLRLYLIVSKRSEGELPALIGVLPGSATAAAWRDLKGT